MSKKHRCCGLRRRLCRLVPSSSGVVLPRAPEGFLLLQELSCHQQILRDSFSFSCRASSSSWRIFFSFSSYRVSSSSWGTPSALGAVVPPTALKWFLLQELSCLQQLLRCPRRPALANFLLPSGRALQPRLHAGCSRWSFTRVLGHSLSLQVLSLSLLEFPFFFFWCLYFIFKSFHLSSPLPDLLFPSSFPFLRTFFLLFLRTCTWLFSNSIFVFSHFFLSLLPATYITFRSSIYPYPRRFPDFFCQPFYSFYNLFHHFFELILSFFF